MTLTAFARRTQAWGRVPRSRERAVEALESGPAGHRVRGVGGRQGNRGIVVVQCFFQFWHAGSRLHIAERCCGRRSYLRFVVSERLFRDSLGFGIVRHQSQNADRRDASIRSVRSAGVSKDLPCLCFPTLSSFGSGWRLLPGLACLRLSRRRVYSSWAHRFIARRRVRICWLLLGRRIRLRRRRRRSCGPLLRKQQTRCEKHKSRTSWHGCGTHVCTIDSQYAELRCSSTRFGEAVFGRFYNKEDVKRSRVSSSAARG